MAMSMRWMLLVACFQDSNKDMGKKYSDQLSDFVVYGTLSFKSTTMIYQNEYTEDRPGRRLL